MAPIPITRAEYEAKFGGGNAIASSPIPITRAEYEAKFSSAPSSPQISANQTSLGRLASVGQGGFGGFLDEAASGVQSLGGYLGALTSGNKEGLSLSDIYQEKLAQNRDGIEQYQEADPTMSTALEIGGSLLSPINKVAAGGKGVLGAVRAAGVQGGIYGAGQAEGNENIIGDTLKGAAISGGSSGILSGLGKIAKGVGDKTGQLAKSTENSLFGIQYNDIKQSLNKDIRARGLDIDDSPIEKAVERLSNKGIIKAGDPIKNLENVELSVKSLNEDLGSLYKSIDEVQQDFIEPSFNHVDEFIKKLDPTSKKQMLNEFNKLKADQLGSNLSYSEWANTASSLNKQGANTLGLQGSDAFTPELKKFMARDINEALQAELGKPQYRGIKDQVIATKQGLSDGFKTQEVLTKAAAREKAATPDGIISGLIRTSGGYGVPMLIGAGAGQATGIGALAGAGAGLALRSNAGRKGLVKILQGSNKAADPLSILAEKLAPIAGQATRTLTRDSEDTSQEPHQYNARNDFGGASSLLSSPQILNNSSLETPLRSLQGQSASSLSLPLSRANRIDGKDPLMNSPLSDRSKELEESKSAQSNTPTSSLSQLKSLMSDYKAKDMSNKEQNKNILIKTVIESGISDPDELKQFMAQMEHESGGFKHLKEKGSGAKYEGRKDLGNTQKGDGEKFKGRGFVQLTGRYNYKKYGDLIGVDLIKNPELAEKPEIAAKLAAAYWNDRVKPNVSDFKDIKAVTKLINGGYNGLADRQQKLANYNSEGNDILALLQEIASRKA